MDNILKSTKAAKKTTPAIKSQKRIIGTLANKIIIADDFDEMPKEFMKHFR